MEGGRRHEEREIGGGRCKVRVGGREGGREGEM